MTVHAPIETRDRSLPRWAIGLTVFVFLVGGVYLASNLTGENPPFAIPGASGPAPSGAVDPAVGEALVVQAGCAGCHGEGLGGQGSFPSLQDVESGPQTEKLAPLAEEHPDEWVHLWIDGTTEETAGIERTMPAFGDQLTAEQIEAIVAYLRGL